MPNIASVLKGEIARVARKELRAETEKLKNASAQYRSDIAALKRRVAALEQQVSRIEKTTSKNGPAAVAPDAAARVRFSAKGLQKQRQRLELSAADMGALLGVSAQTIYNWEAGSTRPRDQQKAVIAALRRASKQEVRDHLQRASR